MSIVKVAAIAGVSKSTVSRVINQSQGVSASTVLQVEGAMQKIGYRPSPRRPGPKTRSRAASTAGVKSGMVMFLTLGADIEQLRRMPVYPRLLHGVETAMTEMGLHTLIASCQPGGAVPKMLDPRSIDGVFLLDKLGDAGTPLKLRQALAKLPGVRLMREFEPSALPYDKVYYDNDRIGAVAGEYLADRGHQRVAVINVHPDHGAMPPRVQAFVATATRRGLKADTLVPTIDAGLDELELVGAIKKLVNRLCALSPRPTGLFVASDSQAILVHQVLNELGIKPQHDIDVISSDNEQVAIRGLYPQPATIDLNLDQVGYHAVRQMRYRLENPEAAQVEMRIQPTCVEAGTGSRVWRP